MAGSNSGWPGVDTGCQPRANQSARNKTAMAGDASCSFSLAAWSPATANNLVLCAYVGYSCVEGSTVGLLGVLKVPSR